MRRSASEIIRNLEMRVARLERQIDTYELSRAAYRRIELQTGVTDYYEIDTSYLGGVGSRAGRFHFFVLWEDKDTGLIIAASAYGKLENPAGIKAVEIARGKDLAKVEGKLESKYRAKFKKYPIEKRRFAQLDGGGFVRMKSPITRPI
jgi:hypothetical protein